MLKRGGNASPQKDHWIVWESPVTISEKGTSKKNTYVQLKAFSWGDVDDNCLDDDITLEKFVSYIFGGFVASKIT